MRSRAVGIDKRQNGSAFIGQFYSPVVEHFQSVLRFRPAPSPAGGEACVEHFFKAFYGSPPAQLGARLGADQPKPSVNTLSSSDKLVQSCGLHFELIILRISSK